MNKIATVLFCLLTIKAIPYLAIAQEFRITNDINYDSWPEVDPFTKEIYYYGDNPGERGIYKIPVTGGTGQLTLFYNVPEFFKNGHKAVYLSETDSLVLYDFNTQSKRNLVYINENEAWVSISPGETKISHFYRLPSYYSFLDSSYHVLPYSPFAPESYPYSKIQWKDDDNLIFTKHESPYDTIIVNFNYTNNQLDTLFNLNRANSGIWAIAYNPVYNLLAYSFNTPQFYTYVSLLDLNTMLDTLILYPDTNQTSEFVFIDEMAWNESGRKLGIIGNHPTIPAGELFLFDLLEHKLDTLTVYPATSEGEKMGLRWFGEDTLIYSKYVYQTTQWQIFGFGTNYLSKIIQPNRNKASLFLLRQNYPNPFNPNTTISFNLPRESPVKLVVYDVTGRQVKTLISARYPAGSHQIQWNGRDDHGNAVASGSYAYRIQAGNYIQSKKMMLLK